MEIWKDIPDWLGIYQVSNYGKVKSLARVVPDGDRMRKVKEKILKPSPCKDGYFCVRLSSNSKPITFNIQNLVMLAFVGAKPDGFYICHNNGDPSDNRLENLRYDTPKSNCLDTLIHGRTRYTNRYFSKAKYSYG